MEKIMVLANDADGLYLFRGMLLEALVNKGYEVIASVPNDDRVPDLEAIGVKVIETSIDRRGINPLKDFRLIIRYLKLLRTIKPTLVITYTIKPNVYGGLAARLKGIPYAVNITGLGTAFQRRGLLRRFVTTMYKVGCKKAKVVFFENTDNCKLFIDEKIVNAPRTCLLNGAGVDLDYFQLMDYPDGSETRFLFIGRVMKEKGIDELFSAMKQLVVEGYNCSLDVVGPYEDDYKHIIEQYQREGWLRYHGFQKDVRPYIAKCHCSVLPSWHEGMANTNLESAASGRPVITSNIHGCLEAVEDSVSGFLVNKKDSADLYQVMKKFMELSHEERERMGVSGSERMKTFFDKKKVVLETIEHLQMSVE